MFRGIFAVIITASLLLTGCSVDVFVNVPQKQENRRGQIEYSFATKEEGIELLLSNTDYYDNFTQCELEYRMQKKNVSMDEYIEFAKEQVLDFSEEDKAKIDELMDCFEGLLEENGYSIPYIEPVVFINTTMLEEYGAGAYTHGTQIYLSMNIINNPRYDTFAKRMIAHEMFHCITRSNPEFRKDMYSLINFTVNDKDYPIPPSVKEKCITNPDVEHHDSYATFTINGEKIDCFAVFIATKPFEKEGDSFFDTGTTALVPIDGSDMYYTPEDTSDFYDVFGKNTGYVIDPEECMADNFSYAVNYGAKGPDGEGYPTPEIIDGIISYLSNGDAAAR